MIPPSQLARRLAAQLSEPTMPPRGISPAMSYGRHQGPIRADTRRAAVLIYLYPDKSEWYLPLTLRPSHLTSHGGQISLPGGAVEPGETSSDAARREFYEELGVLCGPHALIGQLATVFVFNSNFVIEPWVACSDDVPEFEPSQDEVAELIRLPLSTLVDRRAREDYRIHRGRLQFTAPAVRHQHFQIWGATRLILADLERRIDSILKPSEPC